MQIEIYHSAEFLWLNHVLGKMKTWDRHKIYTHIKKGCHGNFAWRYVFLNLSKLNIQNTFASSSKVLYQEHTIFKFPNSFWIDTFLNTWQNSINIVAA